MEMGALAPYEQALRGSGSWRRDRTRRTGRLRGLGLRDSAGGHTELDVDRWLAAPDAVDRTVLERCRGPVLDVGCGPGRFVHALHSAGVPALGVDIAETAVELTRALGAPALHRDVYAALPGEGRWQTVLLVDGNIGIGGDPSRLLKRTRLLLAAGGRLIVETHADDDRFDLLDVRFTVVGEETGPPFGWAHVGRDGLLRCATEVGYSSADSWSSGGREFVELVTA